MTPQPRVGSSLTRRDLLKALGLAGSAAAAVPLLNACGVGGGGGPATQNGANEVSGGFDWKKVHVWWVDERAVPPQHERSNYRAAKETFLDAAGVPEANVHRMRGEAEAMASTLAMPSAVSMIARSSRLGPDGVR